MNIFIQFWWFSFFSNGDSICKQQGQWHNGVTFGNHVHATIIYFRFEYHFVFLKMNLKNCQSEASLSW